MTKPLRLFIAIELSSQVKQALGDLQAELRRQLPAKAVRWTNPEGIHLTLKFLGDTPPERVGSIGQALARAAAGFEPFSFAVAGFGCFPNLHKANVLWAGVPQVPKALAGLQRATELHLGQLGYAKDGRDFSPHLTLGRVNRQIPGAERKALAGVLGQVEVGSLGVVPVERVLLFKSDLQPGGAVYSVLSTASLAG